MTADESGDGPADDPGPDHGRGGADEHGGGPAHRWGDDPGPMPDNGPGDQPDGDTGRAPQRPAGRSGVGTPVGTRPRGGSPVTWTLLAAFVAVFVLGQLAGDGRSPILLYGAQFNPLVMAGEWWRVLTATLLHAGITHLFFNGYALYILGPQLERGVGSAAFAALYIASGLAGGLAFLFTAPDQVAVGASGAIFGLFGAWFAASWVNRDTPQGRAGVTQFGVLLLINLALPLFIEGIAWQAHLGGLLVGAVTGLLWARRIRRGGGRRLVGLPVGLAVALLTLLLWYT